MKKTAVLIDGGFAQKRLRNRLPKGSFVQAEHIKKLVHEEIFGHEKLKNSELYRAFYYDAEPLSVELTNPISGNNLDLTKTPTFSHSTSLIKSLKVTEHFAVRLGECIYNKNSWELKQGVVDTWKKTKQTDHQISAKDIKPSIKQKGSGGDKRPQRQIPKEFYRFCRCAKYQA